MIDVNRSRQSMNAVTVAGKNVYPGLYENQVIEAQLAGAAVVGHEDALPEELVGSSRTGLRFGDFNDTAAIFDFMATVIENRKQVAEEAKGWARANHSVSNMTGPLLKAL
jgi:glycosyltransferase involved in cell wall biosynthesis